MTHLKTVADVKNCILLNFEYVNFITLYEPDILTIDIFVGNYGAFYISRRRLNDIKRKLMTALPVGVYLTISNL